MPGKCGDWKKHPHLADIFAACDGGNRRLEHWMTGSAATSPGHAAGRTGRRRWPRTRMSRRPCAQGSIPC
jgi:hypothetical protein